MTSTDLAVPDMAAEIERSADPGEFVVQACERAKAWLTGALEHGEIDAIVELRSQAEAIRVYTASRNLGRDAELAAQEIVRRAEHGLARAVRKGQEEGTIRKAGDPPPLPSAPYQRMRRGVVETVTPPNQPPVRDKDVRSPREFFNGSQDMSDAYALARLSDEEFEAVVEDAKAERNLSRANVVAKARAKTDTVEAKRRSGDLLGGPLPPIPDPDDRTAAANFERRAAIKELAGMGYTSAQIGEMVGRSEAAVKDIIREAGIVNRADEVMARKQGKKIDSNRIVRKTVESVAYIDTGLDMVVWDDLDRDEIPDWIATISAAVRTLNALKKQLKELLP